MRSPTVLLLSKALSLILWFISPIYIRSDASAMKRRNEDITLEVFRGITDEELRLELMDRLADDQLPDTFGYPPPPTPLDIVDPRENRINSQGRWELARFRELRERVLAWSGTWGGIDSWPQSLAVKLAEARESNEMGGVEMWMNDVLEHAQEGRDLLHALERMQGVLPNKAWQIRHLWQLEVECLKKVVRGLAYIDIRVNLFRPDAFNLLDHYDIHNLLKCWGGEDDASDEVILNPRPEVILTSIPKSVSTSIPKSASTSIPKEASIPEAISRRIPGSLLSAVPEALSTLPEGILKPVPQAILATNLEARSAMLAEVTPVPVANSTTIPELLSTSIPEEVLILPERVSRPIPEAILQTISDAISTPIPGAV